MDISSIMNIVIQVCILSIVSKSATYNQKMSKFKNVQDCFKFMKNRGLCLNYFSSVHAIRDCTSRNCFTCGVRHNTMLHQHNITIQNQSAIYEKNSTWSLHSNSNTDLSNSNSRSQDTHSLLDPTQTSNYIKSFQASNSHLVQSNLTRSSSGVLLGTAVIKIHHKGTFYITRALIDSGSEGTFIAERLFKL